MPIGTTVTLTGTTWRDGMDLVAVHRAASLRGECPALNRAEQREAALVMTLKDMGGVEIAARLGVAARSVTRWRGGPGKR